MKVLIVDHEDENRAAMRQILHDLGFEVMQVSDAEHAKPIMDKHPDIDLVMLDSNLPYGSGYDYLVEIRLMPQYMEKPKIVMVTCESRMNHILKALAAGADEYIMKPFDKDMVREKLCIIGVLTEGCKCKQEDSSCQ